MSSSVYYCLYENLVKHEIVALFEGSQYVDLGTTYIHFCTVNKMMGNKIQVKAEYWCVHSRDASKFDWFDASRDLWPVSVLAYFTY